jgi:outer membrane lipase/esterase
MRLRSVGALCAVAMALSVAGPASAQDYGTIVVFGDSLSDDGNLFAASGRAFPPPPYFGGRFSNGPVWVEQLAGYSTDLNFAYGGARTDDTNNFDFPPVIIPGALGVEEQIDQYIGSLGGNPIPADSLVVLWAGANDINASPSLATALTAAQNQTGNLAELVAAGARTVLLPNLPNLGATPGSIAAGPAAQQGGLGLTLAYNQTLDAGVRSLPLPAGTNIIQMDVFSAFNVILADPAAFGFTNVTQACTDVTSCVTGGAAAQNQFLFWDRIHPTVAGHELLARYAGLLLSTESIGLAVAPLAEASFQARLESSQAAFGRTLNALAYPDIWHGGIFAEVIGNRFNGDGQGDAPGYRQDLAGIRAGVEGNIGGAIAGVAVSYVEGEHDQAGLSADTQRAQADIYGGMRIGGGFFVGVDAGISYSDYSEIERDTGFPTVVARGDTEGWGYSAAVNAGYVLEHGAFKLLPNVRVGYLSSSTDAFSESAPLLALEYGDRDIASGFWSAGVRAATTLEMGGRPLQAFAEIGYEGLFATETDNITAHLVGNTALPVSAGVDDPASRGLYLRVGVDGHLDATTTLSADYGLSLSDGDSETHSAKVALKFLFGG